ncbi:MAG: hypothetical protein AB9856_08120 [Cellulosilyticaceae bacterium]
MKHRIKNCLLTTCLSLLSLAIVATLYSAQFLCIATIYQVLFANVLIHLGLTLFQHFESKYFIVEIALEMGYMLVVLILLGFLFGWYSSTPLWVLIVMGITVYVIGGCIDIFRLNNHLDSINDHLKTFNKQD